MADHDVLEAPPVQALVMRDFLERQLDRSYDYTLIIHFATREQETGRALAIPTGLQVDISLPVSHRNKSQFRSAGYVPVPERRIANIVRIRHSKAVWQWARSIGFRSSVITMPCSLKAREICIIPVASGHEVYDYSFPCPCK